MKAQAWGFDLIIAVMIFVVGILAFYFYSINYSGEGSVGFISLKEEGSLIAESLLSSGSPADWNASNVVRIGIYDNGRINETKLEEFYGMDYSTTKSLFRVRDDYYLNFSSSLEIGGNPVDYIGLLPSGEENLAKVERVIVFNDKVGTMEVFVWN